MPENGQASTAPIVLTISSACRRGGPFARMQPALQLPQELIDTAGQTDKLLIIARTMKGFHLLAEYTSAVSLDVPNPRITCAWEDRRGGSALNPRPDQVDRWCWVSDPTYTSAGRRGGRSSKGSPGKCSQLWSSVD